MTCWLANTLDNHVLARTNPTTEANDQRRADAMVEGTHRKALKKFLANIGKYILYNLLRIMVPKYISNMDFHSA